MSNLIYLMGKSATGKDTIYKKIKEKIEVNSYVPYTTRPKRSEEVQAREYNFITKEEFFKLRQQGKVMEYRSYNVINSEGNKDVWIYATVLDKQWNKNGNFLTIGTLESYRSILQYLKLNKNIHLNIIPIYISIDENERRKRALARESKETKENLNEIERRFKADNIDFSEVNLLKAGITKAQTFENYDLDACIDHILKYLKINTKN